MSRFLGFSTGSDGVINLSSYTILKSVCSGTSGSNSLTATNASFTAGQRIFICQMSGTGVGTNFEDNYIVSYTTGTITTLYPLEFTYTNSGASKAQVVVVPQASDYTGSLTLPAWNGTDGGLGCFASISPFNATILATATGFRGGSGSKRSNGSIATQGESYSGTGLASNSANNGGGGGAGELNISSGNGGPGGYGTQGTKDTGGGLKAGNAGTTYGQANLSVIHMGSGGGGGFDNNNVATGGNGGPGGGILRCYFSQVGASAVLRSNGGQGVQSSYNGGSGSGGSLSIYAESIHGSATLSATGGAQVAATRGNLGIGPAGGDGRIHLNVCSWSGTSSPTANTTLGGHDFCSSGVLLY